MNNRLRFKKSLQFLKENIPADLKILDLGTPNKLTKLIKEEGYTVFNTSGEDFDFEYKKVIQSYNVDCYVSFEVFEHLLAPFNILNEIEKGKLVCSVPLRVWFSKAYWNEEKEWDRHFHEFEQRQFDWLLEKTGWEIKKREKWTSPDQYRLGIKPLLRLFFPSYYFVYCEK